jgi:dihydrolipoamide dehydrogenase
VSRYDVAIIGGGPGGYVAAIRAAQLGLKVTLIEKEKVGGLCLNWGCIPSKALLHSAELIDLFARAGDFGVHADGLRSDLGEAVGHSRAVVDQVVKGVEYLLKRNGVEVVNGEAFLRSYNEVVVDGGAVEAEAIIIATGARPRSLPRIEIDGEKVLTSREALALQRPPDSIAIIGGGPVGVEFAYLYRAFGSRVTLIEALPHLLPSEDDDVSAYLERSFAKQGIEVLTNTYLEELDVIDGGCKLGLNGPAGEKTASYDKILLGVGVRANVEGFGLEELDVNAENGFISVDERMETNVPGIYAVGDVIGPPLLAHVASAEGVVAAEAIAGLQPQALSYVDMPRAVYCRPQVASVGLTEAEAKAQGYEVASARFPLRGISRALALGESDGFAKLVVDRDSDEVLGCHMIGPDVTELIGEVSLARMLRASAKDLASTVYAHPTLSEVVKEAALATKGEAVHFWFERAAAQARSN